ncbi:peroxiredoxin, OsmC subfamily (plasmid) [Stanieria cyanosphaera PCC 7437]|uniref:Peroxiredoxin, OsmC subfamily n=1 Tax=Stanieria cyanosphaera (strain ATCC 29371 / PCC 7437) TaxID=111780 RepID=K9Y2B9_STAC7|nr:OsmC family protein [Stanieria cyanosphaera]AFZ38137.1 peroxiredoxin, OsmC subfamily [Stanieria cyanosphaera PCC 7437]
MATIKRTATAVWNGNFKSGDGRINTISGVLQETPYSFTTRFEGSPGTNPEELLAASHAACYSMAFALTLSNKGYQPTNIHTRAVCTLEPQAGGGFKITKIRLETQGQIRDVDADNFQQMAREAEAVCVISNALRQGVEIELDASLA